MRWCDLREWLENIITLQLWDTNYLWLPLINSVTTERKPFPSVVLAVATEQGVIGVEKSVVPIRRSPVLNFSFDQMARMLMKDQRAASRASRHQNVCQTVEWFVMQAIIHVWQHAEWLLWYNGPSHWKAFIDVDSHTFSAAC